MSTTILRFEKFKSFESIRASSSHIFRYADTPNADPDRYKLNKIMIGGRNTEKSLKEFIDKYQVKVRKNAVLAMDGLLTLSPEIFSNGDASERFAEAAVKFLTDEFGGRCISAVLHRDESTPHVHFVVVPAERKRGIVKLNARGQFNKASLAGFQKRYFEHMEQHFDLVPPQHGKRARHKKIRTFYAELERDVDALRAQILDAERNKIQSIIDDKCPEILSSFWRKLDSIVNRKSLELRNEISGHSLELINKYKSMKSDIEFEIESSIKHEQSEELSILIKRVEEKLVSTQLESSMKPKTSKFN
ncbi:plasmid recombination protein [Photobacterium sp. ZSDE20]|nr:plasmid recombination protein [Photobacterium sp. ZSDE20]